MGRGFRAGRRKGVGLWGARGCVRGIMERMCGAKRSGKGSEKGLGKVTFDKELEGMQVF